jgi:hypothetical protein
MTESLRREDDNTVYARRCTECGLAWKIYQNPTHKLDCSAQTVLLRSPSKKKDKMKNLLTQFDESVNTVNLHGGPRPGGKSKDWLKGQDTGIQQGLKIARSILASLLFDTEPTIENGGLGEGL